MQQKHRAQCAHIPDDLSKTLASWCSTVCTTKHPSIPCRPLPVSLQCQLQTTSSLCQPRSSRHALPSSQQLWSADFFFVASPAKWNGLVTRQSERYGHQQRLLQLTRVHSALEFFGRCALQICLLTYLLRPKELLYCTHIENQPRFKAQTFCK